MINKKLTEHLDRLFASYNGLAPVEELKQELLHDLQDKIQDLKQDGVSADDAYTMAIASIGDVTELIESINTKTQELRHSVRMDFSLSDLNNSDLSSTMMPGKNFDYSNLKGSTFANSDLQESSFKASNLAECNFNNAKLSNAKFDKSNLTDATFLGANLIGAQFDKSNLRGATFIGANLDNVDFRMSDLSGVSFDNMTLTGTSFDYSGLKGTTFRQATLYGVSFKTELRKTIFDGAMVDKITYALLKGYGADLRSVKII